MTPIRPQNIVIFSAGESEKNGNLNIVKSFFQNNGHTCCDWHELFANANSSDNIALLPILIKKIPTFDFAIILGDGTERINEFRGKKLNPEENECIMRDNVLFECGLCIMALGTDRVILLIENNVRIPEDLCGVGKIGIEKLVYSNELKDISDKLLKILVHIEIEATKLSPIVIGAAISTADGYFSNFILRFWENIENGFIDCDTNQEFHPDSSQILMEIYIPEKIDSSVKEKIRNYYNKNHYKRGMISKGTFRGVEFRYKKNKEQIKICDIPSAITASYNTVKDILDLSADDSYDSSAEKRFLLKELDSFSFTLDKLMMEGSLTKKLQTFPNSSEDKINYILRVMKQVKIDSLKL